METVLLEIEVYQNKQGRSPFTKWLNSLKDVKARAIIRVRLDRISLGNFGDCKPLGEGVYEIRINFGPGYRVYYGQLGRKVILLLCGGDKNTQSQDIQNAKSYWRDYLKSYEKKI